MIKLVLAVLLSIVITLPASAKGPYVGLGGGLAIAHDSDVELEGYSTGSDTAEYDLGYGMNAVLGYNFDRFRLEAEFAYRQADVDKIADFSVSGIKTTSKSYMLNAYMDSSTTEYPVKPFIGVGVGIVNGEIEGSISSEGYSLVLDNDDTAFAYQLTLGLTSNISENTYIDFYYRFFAVPSDFQHNGIEISYNISNIFAGIRYNF